MKKQSLPLVEIAPRFTTLDGAEFHAATPREFFHLLRQASRDPRASYEEFLQATAGAATAYNGKPHDGTSPEALALDLERSGLIRVSEPELFHPAN